MFDKYRRKKFIQKVQKKKIQSYEAAIGIIKEKFNFDIELIKTVRLIFKNTFDSKDEAELILKYKSPELIECASIETLNECVLVDSSIVQYIPQNIKTEYINSYINKKCFPELFLAIFLELSEKEQYYLFETSDNVRCLSAKINPNIIYKYVAAQKEKSGGAPLIDDFFQNYL